MRNQLNQEKFPLHWAHLETSGSSSRALTGVQVGGFHGVRWGSTPYSLMFCTYDKENDPFSMFSILKKALFLCSIS